jgi:tRNA threonylcarbamoyladenosine biosynthesis protein TsaB
MSMTMDSRAQRKVLALDTCTPRGSVALLEGGNVAAELRLHSLETHSARLLKSVRFLLENLGWSLNEIGLIAAGIGPGSFTGIRIGAATGLGLAQTLGIPFCGISILDAIACEFAQVEGPLGIVLDAQRGQIFFCEYRVKAGIPVKTGRPVLYHPSDLKKLLARRKIRLAGDGVQRYCDALLTPFAKSKYVHGDLFAACSIGRLALSSPRKWRDGEKLCCDPLYIRPPDAKKPKRRK